MLLRLYFLLLNRIGKKSKVKTVKLSKKQQIIQVALQRFSYYGFSKTSMNEIADDLSITKANLYYYYPDKNSLIKDVIISMTAKMVAKEMAIIEKFEGGVLGTLFALLDFNAKCMKKHYVLYISESLEWIKGAEMQTMFEDLHNEDVERMAIVLKKGVEAREIMVDNILDTSRLYIEVVKGLALTRTIYDIMTGIPKVDRIDEILQRQKQATELVFNGLQYKTTTLRLDNE